MLSLRAARSIKTTFPVRPLQPLFASEPMRLLPLCRRRPRYSSSQPLERGGGVGGGAGFGLGFVLAFGATGACMYADASSAHRTVSTVPVPRHDRRHVAGNGENTPVLPRAFRYSPEVAAAEASVAGGIDNPSPRGGSSSDGVPTPGDGGSPSPPVPPTPLRYRVSARALKGYRPYMEDEYAVALHGRFAGVYDGHGGGHVSTYLRQNLHAHYLRALAGGSSRKRRTTRKARQAAAAAAEARGEAAPEMLPPTAIFPPGAPKRPSVQDCAVALRIAFERVDAEVQKIRHWSYQGSTAVAVLIHESFPEESSDGAPPTQQGAGRSKSTIISANVGDSRAVLSRRRRALDLTSDHKPNSPDEKRRVEELGGSVVWHGYTDKKGNPIEGSGVYRINGNLAVARAVGDRSERPFVCADVDIRETEILPEEDEFIVLASDGVWDVMESQDVVDFIHRMLKASVGSISDGTGKSTMNRRKTEMSMSDWSSQYSDDSTMIKAAMSTRRKKMARYVAEESLRRGSMDNITVVIVWLDAAGNAT